MHVILETKDLTIGFGKGKLKKVVTKNINLRFETGKLIAIIGRNGAGKSTLLRTLARLQGALDGFVLVDNKDINEFSNLEVAQKIGLVLTEKLPESNLTVYDIIALGRQPYTNWVGRLNQIDIQAIENAISITNIEHLRNKKHYEISDGQLQIVLIARALAQETPIIILDEPTTHLDLPHKISLVRLLKNLAAHAGKCVVFSTHDIELAIENADLLVTISKGKILQGNANLMIKEGILDSLFDDEQIIFDRFKRKFVFKN